MATNPHVQPLVKAIGRLMHGHPPPKPGSADFDAIARAVHGLYGGEAEADYVAYINLAKEIMVLLGQRLLPTERPVPPRLPVVSKRSKK